MKNIFLFASIILLSFLSTAQSTNVVVRSTQDVTSLKENGTATFYLPKGMAAEDVQDKAKYYTMYFTVSYSSKDGQTTINMVDNNPRSRGVIRRFFVANDIHAVEIAGETLELDAFFEAYLK